MIKKVFWVAVVITVAVSGHAWWKLHHTPPNYGNYIHDSLLTNPGS